MGMGFPDFNGCYIAFPSSEFPRSSRVVISHVSLSWSTQHVLLKQQVLEFICVFDIRRGDSFWIPVSQWGMRERFPHIEQTSLVKFGNANVDQFKYIEGCEFGCLSPGKTPWRQNRATWKSWTGWWIEPFGCTVAQGWRRNPLKLLALVGWNVKAAWDSASADRVMFIDYRL